MPERKNPEIVGAVAVAAELKDKVEEGEENKEVEGKQEAAERKAVKAEAQVIQGRGLYQEKDDDDTDEPSARKGLGATKSAKKGLAVFISVKVPSLRTWRPVVCGRGNQIMDFTRGRLMSRQLLASCMLQHPLSRQRPCFWS